MNRRHVVVLVLVLLVLALLLGPCVLAVLPPG